MKKDGFTLVELLAVVIILAIISLFVMPKVADLIKSGNSTNASIELCLLHIFNAKF